MDPFYGEIRLFGGNYAPVQWAFCNGQSLPVSQNEALYSLFGTLYGGSGTNFNLPDLRGRLPIHFGAGPGLTDRPLASAGGAETVTLNQSNLPQHNHAWMANSAAASSSTPGNNVLANVGAGNTLYETEATFNKPVPAAPNTIGMSGGGAPHDNMMPYLAISFIVALQGIYPTQN